MKARRRQRWFSVACLLLGLCGLTLLCISAQRVPLLQKGLVLIIANQIFWYAVRIGIMTIVWRREPALGAGQKIWLGITAPLPVLAAILWGRGKLSAWLTEPEEVGTP